LLLGKRPDPARIARLDGWEKPRLPIGGGALIARGLDAGPGVAILLKRIEAAWVKAGFPNGDAFEKIVAHYVAEALRDSQ